jgi:hypothetical protein
MAHQGQPHLVATAPYPSLVSGYLPKNMAKNHDVITKYRNFETSKPRNFETLKHRKPKKERI